MMILALDTTTRSGSCALAREGVVLREAQSAPDQPPAARLPGDLMRLLAQAGVALHQIDFFAVATGPGSFTGLRIGIATMQGLAFATGKPLIGISGFEALVAAAVPEGPGRDGAGTAADGVCGVAAWVDAWRGEVYAAHYARGGEMSPPVVAAPSALLRGVTGPMLFVGDGAAAYRPIIEQTLGPHARFAEPLVPPLAARIAQLAGAAARRGALPPPHAIRPLYVRRPDAELARERS